MIIHNCIIKIPMFLHNQPLLWLWIKLVPNKIDITFHMLTPQWWCWVLLCVISCYVIAEQKYSIKPMYEYCLFITMYGFIMLCIKKRECVYCGAELFVSSFKCYLIVYFLCCFAICDINTKINSWVHILLGTTVDIHYSLYQCIIIWPYVLQAYMQ